jgi:1-acyl-sn-glycerol-3-phosphate acyltransferase
MYVAANLCFWIIPVTVLSVVKAVIPLGRVRAAVYWLLVWIYALAVRCDDFVLFTLLGIRVDVSGLGEIHPSQSYIVIANHQSWSDIFVFQHLLTHPPAAVKFLVKWELRYLPIVGLVCWAYDYPFLRRHSKQILQDRPDLRGNDIRTIRSAMEKMGRSPAAVVNLVEGTRFSPAKARARQSPYRHLLPPRAGGLAYILRTMGDRLSAVVDLTVVYDCPRPLFWGLMSGTCRRIVVQAKRTPVTDILGERDDQGEAAAEAVVSWLNTAWKEKDEKIGTIRRDLGLNS